MLLYVVLWVGESVRCATILREQSAINNCEEAMSVCESKEKLGLAMRHTQKRFGVSFREFFSVNS